jgi:4'-phosphopantetheinyl transferase
VKPLQLTNKAAHFYAIHTPSLSEKTFSQLTKALISADQERLDRIRQSGDKNRFVISRGALRLLSKAYSNSDTNTEVLDYSEKGKPYWPDAPHLQFNISHSGDWVVLGFARNREIGVDVQEMRPMSDLNAMSHTAFHPDEQAYFNNLDLNDDRLNTFYQIWSLREAGLKSVGAGLFAHRTQYNVLPLPCTDLEIRSFSGGTPVAKLVTKQIKLAKGYKAAIAVVGDASVQIKQITTVEFQQMLNA